MKLLLVLGTLVLLVTMSACASDVDPVGVWKFDYAGAACGGSGPWEIRVVDGQNGPSFVSGDITGTISCTDAECSMTATEIVGGGASTWFWILRLDGDDVVNGVGNVSLSAGGCSGSVAISNGRIDR